MLLFARPASEFPQRVKWFPGIYAALFIGDTTSNMDTAMAAIPSSKLVGFEKAYPWDAIETSRDVYDWSTVLAHLDYAEAHGKKHQVSLRLGGYNTDEDNLPAYLTGSEFGGGGYTWTNNRRQPVLWNSAVKDRIIAICQSAGAALDDHPALAAFQPVEESANHITVLPGGNAGVDAFNATAFKNNYLAIQVATRAAFATTIVAMGFNFPDFATNNSLNLWAAGATTSKLALNAVDVVKGGVGWENNSYLFFSSLSGQVPMIVVMDYDNFTRTDGGGPWTVQQLFDYARDRMHANFLAVRMRNDVPGTPGHATNYFNRFADIVNDPGFGGINVTYPVGF